MMIAEVTTRLEAIEQTQATIVQLLTGLISEKVVKDFYGVDEVSVAVNRSEWQVREWLRTGRVEGVKRPVGRGRHKEWSVSHVELTRYRNHGLLPLTRAAS